jgi:branched-chain amino acid transport system substrate-binding protein
LRAKWLVTATALAALATGVAACGDDSGSSGGGGGGGGAGSGDISGSSVTIYSSLPLQGGSRDNALAVNRGAEIALQEKGGKVGNYTVKFQKLDDSTASAGKWEPNQVQQNARKAVADKTTIGYLGEFNSGASALSIPTTNRAGILQVSPANTAVGLTSSDPGADAGEPDKYYPTKKRTYGRVVPRDTVQAAAQVTIWKENGCKKVYIVNDKEVYGEGLAKSAEQAVQQQGGVEIVANEGYDPKAGNYRALAGKIKASGADCFFGSIIVDNNGVQLFTDVAQGAPAIKLFGPDGVAEESFAGKDGVAPDVAKRTLITVATLDPDDYPPAGKDFFDRYVKETGDKTPAPYAIYGYETMSVMLDAMKRAADANGGKLSRQAVIDQFFNTKGRDSVLGTYDIDKNGDTTLTDYGLYKIADHELAFEKVIKAGGGGQ